MEGGEGEYCWGAQEQCLGTGGGLLGHRGRPAWAPGEACLGTGGGPPPGGALGVRGGARERAGGGGGGEGGVKEWVRGWWVGWGPPRAAFPSRCAAPNNGESGQGWHAALKQWAVTAVGFWGFRFWERAAVGGDRGRVLQLLGGVRGGGGAPAALRAVQVRGGNRRRRRPGGAAAAAGSSLGERQAGALCLQALAGLVQGGALLEAHLQALGALRLEVGGHPAGGGVGGEGLGGGDRLGNSGQVGAPSRSTPHAARCTPSKRQDGEKAARCGGRQAAGGGGAHLRSAAAEAAPVLSTSLENAELGLASSTEGGAISATWPASMTMTCVGWGQGGGWL